MEYNKTVSVEIKTWEILHRYKIALKHKTLDETINYLIKRARKDGKK